MSPDDAHGEPGVGPPAPANADAVRAIAALDDPSRRALYDLVRASPEPVTREAAAQQLGISRKLAAFHLDKLVDAGLLVADYRSGSRTRTLGRTPKGYRTSALQVAVTIPDRRYQDLAELLIDAMLSARPGETAPEAAFRVGGEAGERAGAEVRAGVRGGRIGPERSLALAETALRARGFEPVRESPTCLTLRNCPYQPLAGRATELVCGVNHRYIAGLVRGLGTSAAQAALEPSSTRCCVVVRA